MWMILQDLKSKAAVAGAECARLTAEIKELREAKAAIANRASLYQVLHCFGDAVAISVVANLFSRVGLCVRRRI